MPFLQTQEFHAVRQMLPVHPADRDGTVFRLFSGKKQPHLMSHQIKFILAHPEQQPSCRFLVKAYRHPERIPAAFLTMMIVERYPAGIVRAHSRIGNPAPAPSDFHKRGVLPHTLEEAVTLLYAASRQKQPGRRCEHGEGMHDRLRGFLQLSIRIQTALYPESMIAYGVMLSHGIKHTGRIHTGQTGFRYIERPALLFLFIYPICFSDRIRILFVDIRADGIQMAAGAMP